MTVWIEAYSWELLRVDAIEYIYLGTTEHGHNVKCMTIGHTVLTLSEPFNYRAEAFVALQGLKEVLCDTSRSGVVEYLDWAFVGNEEGGEES